MEYLNPPYKRFIKTETGKFLKEAQIQETKVIGKHIYVVWDEINFNQVATFCERVIEQADNLNDLNHPIERENKHERHKLRYR